MALPSLPSTRKRALNIIDSHTWLLAGMIEYVNLDLA